jgi:hypothetical protein
VLWYAFACGSPLKPIATVIHGAVGVAVPWLPMVKLNPPVLFDDDQTVIAGLQSKVPVTPPLSCTVQDCDWPGVVVTLLPQPASTPITAAPSRRAFIDSSLRQSTRSAKFSGMSFGKILVLLLGLAIVAYAVKVELAGSATGTPDQTQAKRQLDNVRTRAKELEREQQKDAEQMLQKSDEQK